MAINVCRIVSVQVIDGLSIVPAWSLLRCCRLGWLGVVWGPAALLMVTLGALGTWVEVGSLGAVVLPPHEESPMEQTIRALGAQGSTL